MPPHQVFGSLGHGTGRRADFLLGGFCWFLLAPIFNFWGVYLSCLIEKSPYLPRNLNIDAKNDGVFEHVSRSFQIWRHFGYPP